MRASSTRRGVSSSIKRSREIASKRGCSADSFDRDTGSRRQSRVARARADGFNCSGVGREIFLRIRCRASALAEHVEGVAKRAMRAGASERFLDGLPEHEVRADQPHGLADRRAQGRQPHAADNGVEDCLRRLARMDDARSDAERPRDAETRSAVDLSSPSSQRPAASLSSIRRSAVAASGTRSNASASIISARPSLVESEYGVQKVFDAAEPAGLGTDRLNERRARASTRPSAAAAR